MELYWGNNFYEDVQGSFRMVQVHANWHVGILLQNKIYPMRGKSTYFLYKVREALGPPL